MSFHPLSRKLKARIMAAEEYKNKSSRGKSRKLWLKEGENHSHRHKMISSYKRKNYMTRDKTIFRHIRNMFYILKTLSSVQMSFVLRFGQLFTYQKKKRFGQLFN